MVKSLDIYILSRGNPSILSTCLSSLQASLDKAHIPHATVIVLKNGNDFPTSSTESSFPWVNFVKLPYAVGFSSGNNRLLRSTSASAVLLLNDDTAMAQDCLSILTTQMAAHSEMGCLGANLKNNDGTPQMSGGRALGISSAIQNGLLFMGNMLAIEPIELITTVEWVSGTCMLLRTQAIKNSGGFDEAFDPFYSEDMDLCVRMRRYGWSVGICRDAHVTHLGGTSFTDATQTRYFYIFRGFARFMRKYRSTNALFVFRLIWTLGCIIRLLIGAGITPFLNIQGQKHQRAAFGALQGLWTKKQSCMKYGLDC